MHECLVTCRCTTAGGREGQSFLKLKTLIIFPDFTVREDSLSHKTKTGLKMKGFWISLLYISVNTQQQQQQQFLSVFPYTDGVTLVKNSNKIQKDKKE